MTAVVVVGSINLDIVTECERFPDPGETVAGTTVRYGEGGKGANQARAAARAGADVTFVGAVGDDLSGETVLEPLREAGVRLRVRTAAEPTGLAAITVDCRGENTIVVVPGANRHVALDDADRAAVASADVLLIQLEVPDSVLLDAARAARSGGTTVVLNPSPVRHLPNELWNLVDAAIVNESESRSLAERLGHLDLVVTTFGSDGAALRSPTDTLRAAGREVVVIDTTGAGDAFAGTFVAGWNLPARTRLERANAAGALATTVAGARSAPTAADVDALLDEANRRS